MTRQTREKPIGGPVGFKEYWRCAADNAVTFRNGWHHTGDLGRSDETGYLKTPAGAIRRPKVKEAHGTASV